MAFSSQKKVHLLSNLNSCILMLFLALPTNKKPLKCTHFQWFALLFINCKRRDRDSNPGYPRGYNGFRDRPDRPLWHLSIGGTGTQRYKYTTDIQTICEIISLCSDFYLFRVRKSCASQRNTYLKRQRNHKLDLLILLLTASCFHRLSNPK